MEEDLKHPNISENKENGDIIENEIRPSSSNFHILFDSPPLTCQIREVSIKYLSYHIRFH